MDNAIVWLTGNGHDKYTILKGEDVFIMGEQSINDEITHLKIQEIDPKWMDNRYKRVFDVPQHIEDHVLGY